MNQFQGWVELTLATAIGLHGRIVTRGAGDLVQLDIIPRAELCETRSEALKNRQIRSVQAKLS